MEDIELIKKEVARRELARRNFKDYLPYVHGASWVSTRMSEYLAKEVQKFVEADTGNAYDILVIATPPQHGKSLTLSESFPSWYLGRNPTKRVIMASYNEGTAEKFCRRNSEKLKRVGANLFGHTVGKVDKAVEFELGNGLGRMISRGIMSGITGNPADLIIIDDPIKNREEADSETIRDKLWNEWQNSLKSRLAAKAKVILIMTPWHEDDLRARLLSSEKNIRYIRLPVEAEENDLLGRKIGDPLCPELGKDEKWLEQFKESYINDPNGGARAWQALYQCSPRVEGGNLISRDWWRFYDPEEVDAFATEFISVDAAFKDAETNDYVSIQVWGKVNNNYYCRYCMNRHLSFTNTVMQIRQVRKLYPHAQFLLIEDKANGSAIVDVLRTEMLCIPVTPKGGKVSRVNAISAAIESGHVFLPKDAPWVAEFIDQWSAFPAGEHDDIVDSASQALLRLTQSSGHLFIDDHSEDDAAYEREEMIFLSGDMYQVYDRDQFYLS